MLKNGFVYLLEDWRNDERAFKIGFTTTSVEKRVKQLQTGNSADIVIVSSYQTPNYLKVEKHLHKLFASSHKRGEWFDMSDEKALTFLDECRKADDMINFMLENNPFYK